MADSKYELKCYTCWVRNRDSDPAALFIRTPIRGELRPVCSECATKGFDDVSQRKTLEEGWDEWIIQKIMKE